MKKYQNTDKALKFQKGTLAELNQQTMETIIGGTSEDTGIVDTCTISNTSRPTIIANNF